MMKFCESSKKSKKLRTEDLQENMVFKISAKFRKATEKLDIKLKSGTFKKTILSIVPECQIKLNEKFELFLIIRKTFYEILLNGNLYCQVNHQNEYKETNKVSASGCKIYWIEVDRYLESIEENEIAETSDPNSPNLTTNEKNNQEPEKVDNQIEVPILTITNDDDTSRNLSEYDDVSTSFKSESEKDNDLQINTKFSSENPIQPNDVINIEGKITDLKGESSISFFDENNQNIILQIILMPSESKIICNDFNLEKGWGTKEESLNIVIEETVIVTINVFSNQFQIRINDIEACNFVYRQPISDIRRIGVEGCVLQSVERHNDQNDKDLIEEIEEVAPINYKLLKKDLKPGMNIVIRGRITKHQKRGIIDLQESEEKKIFHIEIDLENNQIVRNDSTPELGYRKEEAWGQNPIRFDKDFKMKIIFHMQQYEIQINGKHFCSFHLRMPYNLIKELILKEFTVHSVEIETESNSHLKIKSRKSSISSANSQISVSKRSEKSYT